jgi:FlaA1/EpsC-like NDP-sugar epimerase
MTSPPTNNQRRVAGYATRILVFGADAFLSIFSWVVSVYILHGFSWHDSFAFLKGYPSAIILFLQLASFLVAGTNNIIIRYIGEKDYKTIFFSVASSSLLFLALWGALYPRLGGYRMLGVVLVDTLALLTLLVGSRMMLRMLYNRLKRPQEPAIGENTAIFGAGELGNMLERVLYHNKSHAYHVVAFFDDNPRVHRKHLNGIPIYDPAKRFEEVIRRLDIRVMIIGVRDLPVERRSELIDACLASGVRVLKVPPTESWLNGSIQVGQLRQVNLDDLLGRAPIQLDDAFVKASIANKVVLVTGCAGSIGSEIVRQLLRHEPVCIVGVDQAETPMHDIALSLRLAVENGLFVPIIADIRDMDSMTRIFQQYRPGYVFHAAAYKHVPLMEQHPDEAVRSNVWGTKLLADLAVQNRVEKFVMVSTDKAVNPANVMGASKRIAEMYVQAINFAGGHHTQFITTRFGNVLGSNGSVISIFREQIERREPVTVTHPDITRYFMTIPEACRLVLEAGAMGNGGEIFVFDMGKQVRIIDLAERMIRLAGLTPGVDIEIRFTGLRPGEKLYEELLDKRETLSETHHPKIFRAKVRPNRMEDIGHAIDLLISGARLGRPAEELVMAMKTLVPEFMSQNSLFSKLDK